MSQSAIKRKPIPALELTGRETERARLRELVAQPGPPVVITGLPGAGKSALAADLARSCAKAAWCEADGAATAHDVLTGLRDTFEDVPELVVLDGLRVDPALIEQLRDLGSSLVITGCGVPASLVVGAMPDPEALELLRRELGQAGESFEDGDLTRLMAISGRLPAGLVDLARRLLARPGWTVADHVDSWRSVGPLADGVRWGLDRLSQELSSETRRAFPLLAAHPGLEWEEQAVAALWGMPAGGRLEELRSHLLVEQEGGRWRLAEGVRAYAQERLLHVAPSIVREAQERLVEHCLTRLESSAGPLDPGWVGRELPNLLAVADLTVSRAQHASTLRFGRFLIPHLLVAPGEAVIREEDAASGHGMLVAPGEAAIRVARAARNAAEAMADPVGEARAELDLAVVYLRAGDFRAAWHAGERALSWARLAGDFEIEITARSGVLQCCMVSGAFPEAVVHLRHIVDWQRRRGKLPELVTSLASLAGVYLRVDADRKAGEACGEAVRIAVGSGLQVELVSALSSQFQVHLRQADMEAATEDLDRAVAAAQSSGDAFSLATVDVLRVRLAVLSEDMAAAEPLFQVAAAAIEALPAPRELAGLQLFWGESYLCRNAPDLARPHFEEVLRLMGCNDIDFLVRIAKLGLAGCDGDQILWNGSEIAIPQQSLPTSIRKVLSARECTVADLVADGHSNRQIASRLGISSRTVEDHVKRICLKLGVISRSAIGRRLAEESADRFEITGEMWA